MMRKEIGKQDMDGTQLKERSRDDSHDVVFKLRKNPGTASTIWGTLDWIGSASEDCSALALRATRMVESAQDEGKVYEEKSLLGFSNTTERLVGAGAGPLWSVFRRKW